MANKENETTNIEKTVGAKSTSTQKKVVNQPQYTVEEFVAAPKTVGAKNVDIVRAALKGKGDTFTVDEAKEFVNKFCKKEVK